MRLLTLSIVLQALCLLVDAFTPVPPNNGWRGAGGPGENDYRGPQAVLAAVGSLYRSSLSERPLLTKSLTTAAVELAGDSIAQHDEKKRGGPEWRWERRRSLGSFLDGLLVTGPLLHFAYGGLERMFPSRASNSNAVVCMMIDEFICDPIDVGVYITSTSLVEGKPVLVRLREKVSGRCLQSVALARELRPLLPLILSLFCCPRVPLPALRVVLPAL